MSVSLKVKIFDSKGTQLLQVAKSTLTIGSASHCDVVLDHPTVNPEHTRAWLEGGRIWVQDLGSPSGTALNEIRLPALKPMLVRDLDVLRLGQCDATLGLEPALVRMPVLKPKVISPANAHSVAAAPVAEAKAPSRDLEIEKRREELATIGRELADLRLQAQMGKLEKDSAQEMAQQLQNLREEIQAVQEQKSKWSETLRQLEAEKIQLRKNIETELAESKSAALLEINTQRKAEVIAQDLWKKESVNELVRLVHNSLAQKVKNWATRPFSQDMVFELESDLNQSFRHVLLGETEFLPAFVPMPSSVPVPVTHTAISAVSHRHAGMNLANAETVVAYRDPTAMGHSGQTGHVTAAPPMPTSAAPPPSSPPPPPPVKESSSKLKSERLRLNPSWKSLTVTSVVLAILMIGLWLGTAYMKQRGTRSLSSQVPDPAAASVRPVERKTPTRFIPRQNRKYRNTYTENVLYLENYVAAEENVDFHKRWVSELSKAAASEWKLDQWSLAPVVAKEQALIQDLGRIRDGIMVDHEQEGINQMRTREAQFQKELEIIFKNHDFVDRFLKFKRAFYTRNQAYITPSN